VVLGFSSAPASTPSQPSSSEPAPSSAPTQEFTSSISLEQPSNALPTSINTISVSSLGVPSSVGLPDSGVSTLTLTSSSTLCTKLEVLFCWCSDFFRSRLLRVLQHPRHLEHPGQTRIRVLGRFVTLNLLGFHL
jgi:hypothetical protein